MKQILGERISELREDLQKRTSEKWPMSKVAVEVGITQNMIERVERGQGGSIETYMLLFNFYQSRGYNLNWLMLSDNSGHIKYALDEGNTIDIEKVLIKVENLKNQLVSDVDTMVMDILINP
jgi:transcriptional regulator with XRE-family HTH domain